LVQDVRASGSAEDRRELRLYDATAGVAARVLSESEAAGDPPGEVTNKAMRAYRQAYRRVIRSLGGDPCK
jgi:hypothetical protein